MRARHRSLERRARSVPRRLSSSAFSRRFTAIARRTLGATRSIFIRLVPAISVWSVPTDILGFCCSSNSRKYENVNRRFCRPLGRDQQLHASPFAFAEPASTQKSLKSEDRTGASWLSERLGITGHHMSVRHHGRVIRSRAAKDECRDRVPLSLLGQMTHDLSDLNPHHWPCAYANCDADKCRTKGC